MLEIGAPSARADRRPWLVLVAAIVLGIAALIGSALGPRGIVRAVDCNDQAVAHDDSYSVLEDSGATTLDVLANDECTGELSDYILFVAGTTGDASWIADTVHYTPVPNLAGSDSFSYSFASAFGASNFASVAITVVPVNDAPGFSITVNTTGATLAEDSGPYTSPGTVSATYPGGGADEAGQAVTVGAVPADPSLFSVAPYFDSGGHLHFTPAPNKSGSTVVTYRAHDSGGTANGGVDTGAPYQDTITITSVADVPKGVPDAYATMPGALLAVAAPGVLANDSDADGQAITATASSLPAHGTLSLAPNGSFTYQPATGYAGGDTFSYTVSDGGLTSGPITVGLTISTTPPPTTRPTASSGAEPTDSVASASPEDSLGPDASLTPGASSTAAPGASASAAPTPAGSGGTTGSDLTPIVVAILIAGLLITSGIVAAGYLRRRPGGGVPPTP